MNIWFYERLVGKRNSWKMKESIINKRLKKYIEDGLQRFVERTRKPDGDWVQLASPNCSIFWSVIKRDCTDCIELEQRPQVFKLTTVKKCNVLLQRYYKRSLIRGRTTSNHNDKLKMTCDSRACLWQNCFDKTEFFLRVDSVSLMYET